MLGWPRNAAYKTLRSFLSRSNRSAHAHVLGFDEALVIGVRLQIKLGQCRSAGTKEMLTDTLTRLHRAVDERIEFERDFAARGFTINDCVQNYSALPF